ncbi:MAG: transcription antitermination factor NusB [Ilumatobacteraceae bacterium]
MANRRRQPQSDARSDARERALTLLYEAESKSITPREVIAHQIVDPDPLTVQLCEGVEDDRARLDELISSHAKGWTIQRMPSIDRTVLRMAIFELGARPDTPTAVVIDEAVELAKRFSTDDSGKFVNGMLSAIAPKVRPPAA